MSGFQFLSDRVANKRDAARQATPAETSLRLCAMQTAAARMDWERRFIFSHATPRGTVADVMLATAQLGAQIDELLATQGIERVLAEDPLDLRRALIESGARYQVVESHRSVAPDDVRWGVVELREKAVATVALFSNPVLAVCAARALSLPLEPPTGSGLRRYRLRLGRGHLGCRTAGVAASPDAWTITAFAQIPQEIVERWRLIAQRIVDPVEGEQVEGDQQQEKRAA